MIKNSIRLASFLFALLSFLLVFQYLGFEQQLFPFGTNGGFELNIDHLKISKEECIRNLNDITAKNNSVLVKIAADPEHYDSKKNVIWFGAKEPEANHIIVKNEKVYWLDADLTGDMISSTEMGARPLYGTYAAKGSVEFKNELIKWADENGVIVSWYKQTPFIETLASYFSRSGIGNAIVTAFLLLLATAIGWFVAHAKARSIRLLGGVAQKRIHLEDTWSIIKLTIDGYVAAWIVMIGYVVFSNRLSQVSLIIGPSLFAFAFLLLLAAMFAGGISLLVRPKIEHLTTREIPLKRFRLLGAGARIISIILAMVIVPSIITSAYILHQLSSEYSLWAKIQNDVRISFGNIDKSAIDKILPYIDEFCNQMEQENNLSLSLVIDKAIFLDPPEYGGYDHIIITNKEWVDSFEVGIDREGKGGELKEVSFETLAEPLRKFLEVQIPIWTRSETVQPNGIGYYEFTGEKFPGLPPDVGYSSTTVQAKHPLVILVDSPVSTLKTKGFLLSVLSSGNIVFLDQKAMLAALSISPINEYVTSVDTVADVALGMAQKFAKETIFYITACILILIAMVFAGIMDAQLWTEANKKRIFTLHTFGRTYHKIMWGAFKRESVIAITTILIGCGISYVIKYPNLITLLGAAVVFAILYGAANFLAYQICIRSMFYKMSRRDD